ncbi:MAG: energy-coupling factor ABC transporter permease [bacterium]
MHAPDGFYNTGLCIVMDGVCLGVIAYSVKKVLKKLDRKVVALAATVGALVFAVQMANFCVSKGSSCHFMGGVFASIILGPYLSTIMVSIMHLVQVFVFQDGGVLSLGPNLLTIVIISTFLGYYLYRIFKSLVIEPYGTYIGAFISAWLTLLITAITVSTMLALSGVDSMAATLGPMVGPHVLVGAMEGLVTVLLLLVVQRMSPDLLNASRYYTGKVMPAGYGKSRIKTQHLLLLIALFVGIIFSPFASRNPDGLEKLALDRGFSETHTTLYYHAPLADYYIPGVENERMSRGCAGFLGTLITFSICWGIGMMLARRGKELTGASNMRCGSEVVGYEKKG